MTCEDCIHFGVCRFSFDVEEPIDIYAFHYLGKKDLHNKAEDACSDFKDKSRFVELPCKVGDRIYYIHKGRVNWRPITNQSIYSIATNGRLGVTCFLTREEAEKKLEEMQI